MAGECLVSSMGLAASAWTLKATSIRVRLTNVSEFRNSFTSNMKKDYEINENNEIDEKFIVFLYFLLYRIPSSSPQLHNMKINRHTYIGATFLALLIALFLGQTVLEKMTTAQGKIMAPSFEVDPLWPKPLPNRWYIGSTIGVAVDAQDHIWIVHRPDTLSPNEAAADQKTGSCCSKAPPVLEFDQAGNLIGHWGGPGQGYEWPDSNHGITIDYKGNVWIGGNGP